jgi:hypothetical protein
MAPLSKIMQGIQQSYTIFFHKKYNTTGHLFQGRYNSILCQQEVYQMELIRYIHLNPVRAGLVQKPEDYRWSSYLNYLWDNEEDIIAKNTILERFSKDESKAKRMFLQFVNDGVAQNHRLDFGKGTDPRILGSPDFVNSVKDKLKGKKSHNDHENYFCTHRLKKVPLFDILKIISKTIKVSSESITSDGREQKVSEARSLFVYFAVRYCGYKIKELGEYLKRDPSSASLMVKKVEAKMEKNVLFSQTVGKITKVIKVINV